MCIEKQSVFVYNGVRYIFFLLPFQGLRGEAGERGSPGFPGARGPGGQKVCSGNTSIAASLMRITHALCNKHWAFINNK